MNNKIEEEKLDEVNGGLSSEELYELKLGDEFYLYYDGERIARVMFAGVLRKTNVLRQNRVLVQLKEIIKSSEYSASEIYYPDPYNNLKNFRRGSEFYVARGDLEKI